jgi:hypothetical protein
MHVGEDLVMLLAELMERFIIWYSKLEEEELFIR